MGGNRLLYGLACGCGFIVVVGVIVGAVVGSSYKTVNYDEVALLQNKVTKKILSDDPYHAGRYYVGTRGHFLKFNKTYQEMDVKATPRVSGQPVTVRALIQYRIKPRMLRDIYTSFQLNLESKLATRAKNALTITCEKFETADFFYNMEEVEKEALKAVKAEISEYVQVPAVLVQHVRFSNTVEENVLKPTYSYWDAQIKLAEEDALVIRTETNALVNNFRAESTALQNTLSAQTEQQRLEIESNLTRIQADTKNMVDNINVTAETQLSVYNQETDNEKAVLEADETVIREDTTQIVTLKQLQVELLAALHDIEITELGTEANSTASAILTLNQAQIDALVLNARSFAFLDLLTTLSLNVDEALDMMFPGMMFNRTAESSFVKVPLPEQLLLEGQCSRIFGCEGGESYNVTL